MHAREGTCPILGTAHGDRTAEEATCGLRLIRIGRLSGNRNARCVLTLLVLTSLATLPACRAAERSLAQCRPVRFAVIADPHLHNARLGHAGAAFEKYLDQDPKLLRESEAILDAALNMVAEEQVQFALIVGDLTKDGELVNHRRMVRHLARLERRGIRVFVVPGNHDINNPEAVEYVGDTNRPVASISPAQFRTLYKRFGYSEAIDLDAHSLSYVAEPVRGLWLLAIDSCKYDESPRLGYNVIGGRIRPETLTWIEAKLRQAHARGKRVIAFMHHGLNQHFIGQNEQFADYLVDNWPAVSAQLARAGLKVIFTGHYHSQDAAYLVDETLKPVSELCDVQTAALVQYPCAFRIVTLDTNGMLRIETRRVTRVNADFADAPFQRHAEDFLRARLIPLVARQLVRRFDLPEADAAEAAPVVADALIANYVGDEAPPAQVRGMIEDWLNSAEPRRTLGMLLRGIWTDLPPTDNQCAVSLDAN
ncbi:MAG: metallophosphoesterase [Verrucomicrobiae bacterium]|nr:metallophosphoesterase [Verrucomicrobiae bacterium]